MPQSHRPSRFRRCVTIAGAASVGALLLFGGGQNMGPLYGGTGLRANTWPLQQEGLFQPSPISPPEFLFSTPPEYLLSPPPEYLLSPPPQSSWADISFARRLLPFRGRSLPPLKEDQHQSPPQIEEDAVLLPDQEVLVLTAEPVPGNPKCIFQGGASSPARALGRLPGPGRQAYLCPMPDSVQPLHAPRLLPTSAGTAPPVREAEFRTLLNWSNKLVFDAAHLPGGDVLLFAKGVNRRQGVEADAGNVQCIYRGGADGMDASFPAISSAQQVIRCPPPPAPLSSSSINIHVTLAINGEGPIPSLATIPRSTQLSVPRERKLICACTMVRNIAKFLPEWVKYHAAIGVDQFFLYDNASEDDLADQVASLKSGGINISTVAWPWTKTQEAGFSHCAASHKTSCEWMAFMDVDEFIFSPEWNIHENPSKSLLVELVSVNPDVGQIYFPCYDFGPSGQTTHPQEGVCQGYTCRLRKMMRHKSLVRLDAVTDSLLNSIHHFELKSGFQWVWSKLARVNHYKFQAWTEFKSKFSRRVSAYVADWSEPVNLESNDRAPGLGVDPVEPAGWAESFCDIKDKTMKELSEKWFGFGFRGSGSNTEFNSNSDIAPSPSPSPSLP